MTAQYKKTKDSSGNKTYTKKLNGQSENISEAEFNAAKKRLKSYAAKYKIKKGSLAGKKITVKQDFKFKDTVNGKQKHRPKPTVIEIKGGWSVNDNQAVDLYSNNQGKLTIKSQTELWDVLPEAFNIPDWFYGKGGTAGFEQYVGIIDPPAGYEIPYGDSDLIDA